ncbi:hypothetical protein ACTQ49_11565 [Luteococcus sp. Sow4_B9]|uniref:hypothetical protein n=1 Tax=Luteococcus sp. Sow4_B9 TaxID=3438792 RepID=UPI003F96B0F4
MTSPEREPAQPLPAVAPQPAVARRTAPLLVQLGLACVVALAGLACNTMTSRTLLRLADTARLWPMLANLASVLLLLVCLGQFLVWRQAQQEWTGRKDVSLIHLLTPSALGRWVALACGLAGPYAAVRIMQASSTQEASWGWALAGGICTVLATAFGGIHRFDPAGPRGVVPQRWERGREVVTDELLAAHVDPEADTVILRRQHPGS